LNHCSTACTDIQYNALMDHIVQSMRRLSSLRMINFRIVEPSIEKSVGVPDEGPSFEKVLRACVRKFNVLKLLFEYSAKI